MSLNGITIIKISGIVTTLMGLIMVFPLFVSLAYQETHVAKGFLWTLVLCLAVGLGILFFFKTATDTSKLKIREGYLIVALCWLLACIIGSLPYIFSGTLKNFIDAFFESTSGFTTTGISILTDVTSLPKGLLFFRSFAHWLGGMGILIFAISILPALGIGGQRIAKAEAPGPTVEKVSTRMSDSAKILYLMYIVFTILAIILLKLSGLNFLDTFVHAFSSMGTGGLSTYTNGVAYFDSLYVETIVTIFSLLASVNFVLYSYLIKGHWKDVIHDAELKAFVAILVGVVVLITLNLWLTDTYTSLGSSFRHAFFQASAFMSTAGYYTANYSFWPVFSQSILFILLFIGGCSASTCGSIKVIRIVIFFKLIVRGILKRLHPSAVVPVKLSGRTIPADRISSITNFLLMYFAIFVVSAIVLSLDNHDLTTTISASAAALSNTGMGLGLVGPGGSFEIFSPIMRLYLSLVMLAGRLELFTIVLLLTPSFWKPYKNTKI